MNKHLMEEFEEMMLKCPLCEEIVRMKHFKAHECQVENEDPLC